jgi:hypothetical protein
MYVLSTPPPPPHHPQVQDDEEIQYIKFEKFEKVMLKIMLDHLYEPASEDTLMQAFRVRWVLLFVPLSF